MITSEMGLYYYWNRYYVIYFDCGFDKLSHRRQAQPPSTSSATVDKLSAMPLSKALLTLKRSYVYKIKNG
jgi:hypothetical protein